MAKLVHLDAMEITRTLFVHITSRVCICASEGNHLQRRTGLEIIFQIYSSSEFKGAPGHRAKTFPIPIAYNCTTVVKLKSTFDSRHRRIISWGKMSNGPLESGAGVQEACLQVTLLLLLGSYK